MPSDETGKKSRVLKPCDAKSVNGLCLQSKFAKTRNHMKAEKIQVAEKLLNILIRELGKYIF